MGFWIEIFSFIVVLISLDSIAANGRPEDRLQAGYFALLIFCFPFYATALYFYEGLALIHSMAHAAKFVIPTLVSLVLSEVLWHWAKRLFACRNRYCTSGERSIPARIIGRIGQHHYFVVSATRGISPLGKQLVRAVGALPSARG